MANFNEDMLMEIFSWLSGKSLCKFSLVSRSVYKLLSDGFFVQKQSRNMRFLGDSDFFVQCYGFNKTLQLRGNYSEVNQSTRLLPCKGDEFLGGFGKILDSFNGLICSIKDESVPLFLFNPATRRYMQVPVPEDKLGWFNIVFPGEERGSVDDYTLLSVGQSPEWGGEPRFKVFSPSEKMWKDLPGVDIGGRNIKFDLTVQLEGVLYFVSDSGQYFTRWSQNFWPHIVAYNIKDHTTKILKIPKSARKGSFGSDLAIFKWGKPRHSDSSNTICLVIFCRSIFTIWVLRNRVDPGNSFWEMVFRMRIKSMGSNNFDTTMEITGYSILNGTTLLLATDQKLYSYDLLDGTKIQEVCEHDFGGAKLHRVHSFCSTLSSVHTSSSSVPQII